MVYNEDEIVLEFSSSAFLYDQFGYSSDELIAVYGQTYGYDSATGNWGQLKEPLFYVDIQNTQAHIHDDDSDGSDGSGQSEQPVGIPVTVVQG